MNIPVARLAGVSLCELTVLLPCKIVTSRVYKCIRIRKSCEDNGMVPGGLRPFCLSSDCPRTSNCLRFVFYATAQSF